MLLWHLPQQVYFLLPCKAFRVVVLALELHVCNVATCACASLPFTPLVWYNDFGQDSQHRPQGVKSFSYHPAKRPRMSSAITYTNKSYSIGSHFNKS
eukprot:2204755-Amphidinium_carterae.1